MLTFLEMMEKAGVHVLLNAITGDVIMDGDRITGVEYHDMTGTNLIEAKIYIDCTGNGDVAYRVGVPFDSGNEKGEFMTYTMSFILGNVDESKLIDPNSRDQENGYIDPKPLVDLGLSLIHISPNQKL